MMDTKIVIDQIINELKETQTENGSWIDAFDTGIATDAYMIILLRSLEINDEQLIKQLCERILSKQEKNGAWKLFYDEEPGNLSATVEAYYALLYSGFYKKNDRRLCLAKQFILKNGGIEKVHFFTKVMLALTGQYEWPRFFPTPVELILLPNTFPINFYDFSVFGRANLAPIMILATKKYRKKTKKSPNLSDLSLSRTNDWQLNREMQGLSSLISSGIKQLIGFPHYVQSLAIERIKQYMLNRIEQDGTFYNYFSATFLMIFALLSLGHSKRDPIIMKAIDGLKGMQCTIDGHTHMQFTTATIWNTSLTSDALQIAGVKPTDPVIVKANEYLLTKQHVKFGDWIVHNRNVRPGGWGFSDRNTINPDVDDTTTSLRSFCQHVLNDHRLHSSWDRGIRWVLSMQNNDGGWPAFEKEVNKKILHYIPILDGKFLLLDPSTADLTGRTLKFLGAYTSLSTNADVVKKGVNWLFREQEKDGSWYGRWGICYIYGTWAAVTGLRAVGIRSTHRSLQKATKWLKQIQNKDGGWGESCKSDIKNSYIPLGTSTITQTAWALDTLISVEKKRTNTIERAIRFILEAYEKENWTNRYPVGQGMGGAFYIHYESYQRIFPLLALAHYERKYK